MKKTLLNLFFLCFVGLVTSIGQTNVALGKTVTATRVTGPSDGPPVVENDVARLVDGKLASPDGIEVSERYTSWTNSVGGVNIDIDLGGSFTINEYKWYCGSSNTATTYSKPVNDFTFQIWDGAIWVTVDTQVGNADASFEATFAPVTTTKVRLNSTKGNGGFVRYFEVEVYEAAAGFDGDEEIIALSAGAHGGAILNNGASTITDILPVTVDELLASLQLNPSVSAAITDGGVAANGTDPITNSMLLTTTSFFDSDTKVYTLTLTPLSIVTQGGNTVASSTYLTNEASRAVDGDVSATGSRWLFNFDAADFPNTPATLEVDLGGTSDISDVRIYEQNGALEDFKIQYWDGAAWVDALDVVGNTNTPSVFTSSFTSVNTNKVRLYISAARSVSGPTPADNYVRMYEFQVFGSAVLGVEDKEATSFSVYPNPANGDYVNIKSLQPITSVKLYNVLGKEVKASLKGKQVDISSLNAGLYFMNVNNVETVKIIKK